MQYIISHRVQPATHRGYIVVAHTAFAGSRGNKERGYGASGGQIGLRSLMCRAVAPIVLRRSTATFVLGYAIEILDDADPSDDATLRGLSARLVEMTPPHVDQKRDEQGDYAEIVVPDRFPPGAVLVFATTMHGLDADLDALCVADADRAVASCDIVDLNVVLFHADGEERDVTANEIGVYDVPGMGKLPYCGLEGWMHPLRHIMRFNDLGHPLCAHLRDGPWAGEYLVMRLERCAAF